MFDRDVNSVDLQFEQDLFISLCLAALALGCQKAVVGNFFKNPPGNRFLNMAEQELHLGWPTLSVEHTGLAVGRLKHLGRLGRARQQICWVCSAVLEAFGTTQAASGPIQV